MAGGAEPHLAEAVTQVIKQVQDAHLEQLADQGRPCVLGGEDGCWLRGDQGRNHQVGHSPAHCPGRSHRRARQAAVTKLLRRHQAPLGWVVPSTRLSPH